MLPALTGLEWAIRHNQNRTSTPANSCPASPGKSVRVFRFRIFRSCPALARKIICFRFSEICDLIGSFRSDTRGVRVVTNVERNAVDADVPVDERRRGGRRNRVVLAPQSSGVKLAMMRERIASMTVANEKVHRRARISRKTIAQGRPVCSRLYPRFSRSLRNFLRESPGCMRSPGLPCAL